MVAAFCNCVVVVCVYVLHLVLHKLLPFLADRSCLEQKKETILLERQALLFSLSLLLISFSPTTITPYGNLAKDCMFFMLSSDFCADTIQNLGRAHKPVKMDKVVYCFGFTSRHHDYCSSICYCQSKYSPSQQHRPYYISLLFA